MKVASSRNRTASSKVIVLVSVLTIELKVRGFKPGQGDEILRVIGIHSTPSFRGELKPEALCRKILWHVKKSLASTNKNTSQGQILIPFAHSYCLLPDDCAGKVARDTWWTNQISSIDAIVPLWFSIFGLCVYKKIYIIY
jgi:hypothetical protein